MESKQKISQKAWLLRESGKPNFAIAIWTQNLFDYETENDWKGVTNTLLDIAISYKILWDTTRNDVYQKTALKTLKYLKFVSLKNKLPLRKEYFICLGNIMVDQKKYDKALENYAACVSFLKTKEESANNDAHFGFALAKIGNKKGIPLLLKSISVLDKSASKNVFQNKEVTTIWKLGAMLKLAEITNDIKLVQTVIKEAKDKNLGARLKQAENLLKQITDK